MDAYQDSYCYDPEHPWHDGEEDDESSFSHRKQRRRKKHKKATTSARKDPPPSLDLTIRGTSCPLHNNDDMAAQLENLLLNYFDNSAVAVSNDDFEGGEEEIDLDHVDDDHLSSLHDNVVVLEKTNLPTDRQQQSSVRPNDKSKEELWMDRYDVRFLLDGYTAFSRRQKACRDTATATAGKMNAEEEELDFERYGLLPEFLLGKTISGKNDKNSSDNGQSMKTEEKEAEEQIELFQLSPEEEKVFPKGIITPQTKHQDNVIRLTAARTAPAPQLEILLRVKQAANPEFSFLNCGSVLYDYYCWRKDCILEEANIDDAADSACLVDYASSDDDHDRDDKSSDTAPGPFLLGMYSSSEEEEEEDDKKISEKKETKETDDGIFKSQRLDSDIVGEKDSGEVISSASNMHPPPSKDDTAEGQVLNNSNHENNPSNGSSITASFCERKAKRLERARMMKGHFNLKML